MIPLHRPALPGMPETERGNMNIPQPKLRPPEAAKYLGIAESTLAKRRMRCEAPAFRKLGRAVVYDRADLDAWLAAHRIDAGKAA